MKMIMKVYLKFLPIVLMKKMNLFYKYGYKGKINLLSVVIH